MGLILLCSAVGQHSARKCICRHDNDCTITVPSLCRTVPCSTVPYRTVHYASLHSHYFTARRCTVGHGSCLHNALKTMVRYEPHGTLCVVLSIYSRQQWTPFRIYVSAHQRGVTHEKGQHTMSSLFYDSAPRYLRGACTCFLIARGAQQSNRPPLRPWS